MTVTMHIDHRHLSPLASLRDGSLEMPRLMARLKPADILRIVQRQTNHLHQVVTAKSLGLTE